MLKRFLKLTCSLLLGVLFVQTAHAQCGTLFEIQGVPSTGMCSNRWIAVGGPSNPILDISVVNNTTLEIQFQSNNGVTYIPAKARLVCARDSFTFHPLGQYIGQSSYLDRGGGRLDSLGYIHIDVSIGDGKHYERCNYVVASSSVSRARPKDVGIRVGPGPVVDWLRVRVLNSSLLAKRLRFELYNLAGQSLMGPVDMNTQEERFDLSGMPPGLYFYRVSGTEWVLSTGKVLRQD